MATCVSVPGGEGHGKMGAPRALFRQPLALQWFEEGKKGVQKRNEEERQAGRFELFLDLLYVAILANFAEHLAEHVSGDALNLYILILVPAWHVWSDLRELMNSFYNDDLAQRILILWIMAVLVIFGNNAPLVAEDIGALRSATGAYITCRLSANLAHLLYSFSDYRHRPQQRLWVFTSTLALCLYIPLFVEDISLRSKVAVAWVAEIMEEGIWFFTYSPVAKRMLKARFTTAVDIAHEVDRFAAFFIIVLGEFLYRIVVGSPAAVGFNLGLLRAIWTLVIAFCLNWMYVHGDGSMNSVHPLRHSTHAAFAWVFLHMPLVAALLAAGHVAANTSTSEEIHHEEVWLLGGGLGTGIIILWVIAMLSECHDAPGSLLLSKYFRLGFRPIIGIIYCCLPLAHDLSITAFLSICTALIVFVVLWENITSLKRGAAFWETWTNTQEPKVSDVLSRVEDNQAVSSAEHGKHGGSATVGHATGHDSSTDHVSHDVSTTLEKGHHQKFNHGFG